MQSVTRAIVQGARHVCPTGVLARCGAANSVELIISYDRGIQELRRLCLISGVEHARVYIEFSDRQALWANIGFETTSEDKRMSVTLLATDLHLLKAYGDCTKFDYFHTHPVEAQRRFFLRRLDEQQRQLALPLEKRADKWLINHVLLTRERVLACFPSKNDLVVYRDLLAQRAKIPLEFKIVSQDGISAIQLETEDSKSLLEAHSQAMRAIQDGDLNTDALHAGNAEAVRRDFFNTVNLIAKGYFRMSFSPFNSDLDRLPPTSLAKTIQ